MIRKGIGECRAITLTNGTDIITPTTHLLNDGVSSPTSRPGSGDDLFLASGATNFTDADVLDGGAGIDTLKFSVTAASGTQKLSGLTSIENVVATITATDTKTHTINADNNSGITTLTLKDAGAASMSSNDELITVSNLNRATVLGIQGGTASSGNTASEITATFKDAVAGDTQKVAISEAGKVGVLTLSTAETVEITATGTGAKANEIGSLKAVSAKTLNIKGDGKVTIAASDLAGTVTVDASTNKGGVDFAAEDGSALTFKGGVGNDRVLLSGKAQLTSADNIDLGGGTNTLAIGTVTDWTSSGINAAEKALIAGVKNAQVLEATAANVTAVNFDYLPFTTVALSGANSNTTVAVADVVTGDKLVLKTSVTKTAAGDTITVAGKGAANTFGLELNGAAAVVVSGTDGTAGNSALSITSGVTTVNIHSTTTATDKSTITNEIKTHTATATHDIENGNAGTFNITGDTNLKIGLAGQTAGFNAAVNIDATNFTGKLEARGSAVVDNIKGGSGNDTFIATTGADTYTLNGGNDTVKFGALTTSVVGARSKITDFNTSGNDKIDLSALTNVQLTATQLTSVQTAVNALASSASVTDALGAAAGASDVANGTFWFEFGGNTYILKEAVATTAFDAAADLVIELTGTGLNLSYANDFILA